MILSHLNIHHVRNISSANLRLHPRYTLVYGANGSGKTSLLEAMYLLGTGHSFRTREILPLITQGEPSLTVFARSLAGDSLSIQKSLSGPTQVKHNNQPCYSSSELARFLPCQVFYHDIFQIIDAGPSVRRSLLDWGLFHVEPSYLGLLKEYRRVLKQRNALLRQESNPSYYKPWDALLVELSYALDKLRADYVEKWAYSFQTIIEKLTDTPCTMTYYRGWDRKNNGRSLATLLVGQFSQDLQRQYTYSGAHQADIYFDSEAFKAKLRLSRGQQKIILIALKIAQASLLQGDCLYLFDDLAAELDTRHQIRVLECLEHVKGQMILTSVEPLPSSEHLFSEATVFALDEGVFASLANERF